MRRWMHSVAFGSVVALLGVGSLISPTGFLIERNFGLDWLFKLRGAVESPAGVAVVGIDGQSGRQMGLSRLPRDWPRTTHAELTRRVVDAGAHAIVFDFDFSRAKVEEHDLALAAAVRKAGRVILFERLEGRRERLVTSSGAGRWVWRELASPPMPDLQAAARAVGPFPLPKIDKSSYQFWAFKPSRDDAPTTAALAVQLALMPQHDAWSHALEAAGMERPPDAVALQAPGGLAEYMRELRKRFRGEPGLSELVVSLSDQLGLQDYEKDAVRILARLYGGPSERFTNYYGPPGTILTIPYHEVLKAERQVATAGGDVPAPAGAFDAMLGGRTVFVGYSDLSEPDQPDRFYTVFTSDNGIDLSGVEIMATAFANLMSDSTVRRLEPTAAIALVAVFGLLISQIVFWPPAYLGLPALALVGTGYTWLVAEWFAEAAVWAPLATPLGLQLPVAIVAGLLGQYIIERRQKMRVGAAMAQYLPEDMVRELTEGRVDPSSFNRVVHGVCLATDMSGFSTISEQRSPEALAKFMNAYFDAIAQALKACRVDVTEFHADTIVCAWLGEAEDEEVRRRSVGAALAVVETIERFVADDPDLRLTARVGLQQGSFYLGHTGGGGRMSYSILGDPANGASRLEGLNKRFGTSILAAASVVEDLDEFLLRPLGDFTVVGKSEVIAVVEVMGRSDQADERSRHLCAGHAAALEHFRAEAWTEAADAFRALSEEFPLDRLIQFYLELTERYAAGKAPAEQPTLIAMTEK